MLTLNEKVQVIQAVDNVQSYRSVAVKFKCGKSQVQCIMMDKSNIMRLYSEGLNANVKYLATRCMQYPEVDEQTWEFFCLTWSKSIPVTSSMLQAKALEIAIKLGVDNKFQASNSWLDSFSSRHQIKMAQLHGQSAEVSQEAVEQWTSRLPEKF